MSIVETDLPVTSARVEEYLNQLGRAYPFLEIEQLARSAYARPLWAVTIGEAEGDSSARPSAARVISRLRQTNDNIMLHLLQ